MTNIKDDFVSIGIDQIYDTMKRRQGLMWSIHNLIAHPLSELVHLIGKEDLSLWIHDVTVPPHKPGTGRG